MNRGILTAVGGLVLFLLGLVIGLASGGPSAEDIRAAVGERLDEASAAQSERIAAIESSVGELRSDIAGRLDGLSTNVDAGAQSFAGIGEELRGLGSAIATTVQTASADQLAAIESSLAGLRGQIAAPAAAPATEAAPEATAVAAAPADPAAPAEGYTAGHTAVIGAARVFVSRVDATTQTVRVRIGGEDIDLALGQPQTIAAGDAECRLTLDAIDRGHAAITGACGDDLPDPAGATPGQTVALTDGLRVFVSAVTDDAARIAINGVETRTVRVGESVEAAAGEETCAVSVTGVDRGHVALGYTCG